MREIYYYLVFLLFQLFDSKLYASFHFNDERFIRKCEFDNETKNPCSEDNIVLYLADIQVINPENIVGLAIENLQYLCRSILETMQKIDKYFKTCKPPNEDNLYMSLLSGVKFLEEKLCLNSEFYKEFNIYYPCLHELKNDFDSCSGPADWNEDTDKEEICRVYKNILDCYYIKSAKVCGNQAAITFRGLIKEVVDNVIKIKCAGINQNPYVKDPMPESYIKKYGSMAVSLHVDMKVVLCLFTATMYN